MSTLLQPERDFRQIDPHHVLAHMYDSSLPMPPSSLPGPSSTHPPPQSQMVTSLPVLSIPQRPPNPNVPSCIARLTQANEQTWLHIGHIAMKMKDQTQALFAYEKALDHNPMSLDGLIQVAGIAQTQENFPKAIELFKRVIGLQQNNGQVWCALGHCHLMQRDLQEASDAYQNALRHLPRPVEDPKLWYGMGILYDRQGSLDLAQEAFATVLRIDEDFEQAKEIIFRKGMLYKQQGKYIESIDCFDRVLRKPPKPFVCSDVWLHIGHAYELQGDHIHARDAYERVIADNPGHAKALQQLGWLYNQDGSVIQNQKCAIVYLTKSIEADSEDAQSWYLLGRAYMADHNGSKAHEALQQAVSRDGVNPIFWCSIGILFYHENQYRDALDAFSRAIHINPYISEVWFNLGKLYESCKNHIPDAIIAYTRAAELNPSNTVITQRLHLVRTTQATGDVLPAATGPQEIRPTTYADSQGPPGDLPPSVPPQLATRSSSNPFGGGPLPPIIVDEIHHHPSHTAPAQIDMGRPPTGPHPRFACDNGPYEQSLLLRHSVPQQQEQPEPLRTPSHSHDPTLSRMRIQSILSSPPPHALGPSLAASSHGHAAFGVDPRDHQHAVSPDLMLMLAQPHKSSPILEASGMPQVTVSEQKDRRRRSNKDKESKSGEPAPAKYLRGKKGMTTAERVQEKQPPATNGAGPPQCRLEDDRGVKDSLSLEPTYGSCSTSRSVQLSPTRSTHAAPSRMFNEDYVADTLLEFHADPRPFSLGGKRTLSQESERDEVHAAKRSRAESNARHVSPHSASTECPTPTPSMRLSPVRDHCQPASHSPETRQSLDTRSSSPSASPRLTHSQPV